MLATNAQYQSLRLATPLCRLTIINLVELADQVQANFTKVVLEQREENGEQILNRGVFTEQRSETRDLGSQRGANVLARVGREVLDAG